jgi:hypothetical protein
MHVRRPVWGCLDQDSATSRVGGGTISKIVLISNPKNIALERARTCPEMECLRHAVSVGTWQGGCCNAEPARQHPRGLRHCDAANRLARLQFLWNKIPACANHGGPMYVIDSGPIEAYATSRLALGESRREVK